MIKNESIIENTITEENTTTNEEISLVENLLYEEGVVTPELYGAVGDGVADDTQAIQACFNGVGNSNQKILFTSGKNYKITASIDISALGSTFCKRVVIGYGSTITVAFNGYAFEAICPFLDDGERASNAFNCTFMGLRINAVTSGVGSGFFIDYYNNLDFEECMFCNLKYGIYATDMYYHNIIKCQFIGCKIGMVFDCFEHYEVNNVVIDKCRLTNGLSGIYFKAVPYGCRITNCSIESYKYGVCGLSGKAGGGQGALFFSQNYLEQNEVHMLFSGVNIKEPGEIEAEYAEYLTSTENPSTFEIFLNDNGYIADDVFYIKLFPGSRSVKTKIIRNYFVGTGKIIVGCSSYQFRENCFYTRDCIELENRVGHNAFIEIDDDLYIKTLGTVYLRTHIKTKNDLITPHPKGKNLLCRNIRDSHYFVNGIGKMQLITNTDMIYPLYDGSFNPDESYKYPLGTTIKIDGKNYPCYGDLKNANNPFRKYSDKKYAYAPIKQLIAQGKDDSDRYVVDATSGMLIDFRNHKYCGTLYGTTVTDNDAYGTEFPTSPIENEIFYKTDEEKYYLWDTGSWKECNYISKKTFG